MARLHKFLGDVGRSNGQRDLNAPKPVQAASPTPDLQAGLEKKTAALAAKKTELTKLEKEHPAQAQLADAHKEFESQERIDQAIADSGFATASRAARERPPGLNGNGLAISSLRAEIEKLEADVRVLRNDIGTQNARQQFGL